MRSRILSRLSSLSVSEGVAVASLAMTLLSAGFAYFAWKSADTLSKNSQYFAIIGTRIQSCSSLASFHSPSKPSIGDESSNTKKGDPVLTTENKVVTSVEERREKEADLSRALTLCLANNSEFETVKFCVDEVNARMAHKVHDDISPTDHTGTRLGKDNLPC